MPPSPLEAFAITSPGWLTLEFPWLPAREPATSEFVFFFGAVDPAALPPETRGWPPVVSCVPGLRPVGETAPEPGPVMPWFKFPNRLEKKSAAEVGVPVIDGLPGGRGFVVVVPPETPVARLVVVAAGRTGLTGVLVGEL